MTVKLDTKGIDISIEKIKKFDEEFMKEFLRRVQARTPVITGALRDGWEWTKSEQGQVITNDQDYALFVEMGTEHMAPRGMVRTTAKEVNQIAEQAKKKAGIK